MRLLTHHSAASSECHSVYSPIFILYYLQGPKPGKKSKKQRFHHVSDMVDLGDGYDETDAFIDNSEAVSKKIFTLKF